MYEFSETILGVWALLFSWLMPTKSSKNSKVSYIKTHVNI